MKNSINVPTNNQPSQPTPGNPDEGQSVQPSNPSTEINPAKPPLS